MKKTKGIKKTKNTRSALRVEALEQRQLLAGIPNGGGSEVLSNVVHPNGNVYDQVLMSGSSVTVTADAGQITRVSFLDLQGDIVQAEFAGAGTLTISMDATGFATGVAPAKYNQTGVSYVQGLATFTIQGSDSSTNFAVFSVGSGNAVNQALFDATHTGGNNMADVSRLTIVANPANPNGSTFGSILAGNASFSDDEGPTGVTATNIQVQGTVTIGDINATASAIPYLVFGDKSQFGAVKVAGGDLVNDNKASINNTGSYGYQLNLAAGATSAGTSLPAATTGNSLSFTGANPLNAAAKTITLTNGIDNAAGGSSNDTINATNTTLTALDAVDGAEGTDVMNIEDLAGAFALPGGVTIKNVEMINFRSAAGAAINTSSLTGVTNLNVTQGSSATITAGSSTVVNIAGITGAITANGGSDVTATTSAGAVTIGATTGPAGAITVSHTAQGANALAVDGGTTVNLTAGGVSTGTVAIGAATKPSGAVTVTSNGAAYAVGTSVTLGAVGVTGGSTVSVTQTAASSNAGASTDAAVGTITQSAVTVTGGNSTTAVTVSQSNAVTPVNYVAATAAGVKESSEVTFVAMAKGETVTVDTAGTPFTFTAAKNLTASEVAAAFANLASGATHGSAGTGSGIYSGTLTNWNAGAANGAKVTFTHSSFGNQTDMAVADTAAAGNAAAVKAADGSGAAAAAATTGVMGIAGGAVTITDGATGADTIASVTLSGYGTTGITSDALTSLSLANSSKTVTVTNTVATTLGLTVNNLTGASNLIDANNKYTTVNVTTTGSDSTLDIDATSVSGLTVAGSKKLTLAAGSSLGGLKTVTVTGTAALTTGGVGSATITSIDTTGTTGAVSASVDPGVGTYTGGAGADTVTFVTTTAPSKAASLGAGDDSLTLVAGTTTSTAALDGGDGTDTLVMAVADAVTASGTAVFQNSIAGFEKLTLSGQIAASGTVNLDNLDGISYVTTGGTAAGQTLTITKLAAAGTVALAGSGAGTSTVVSLKDATGSADSLSLVVAHATPGLVEAAAIETVNVSVTTAGALTLKAADATTVNVIGSKNLTLTFDAATDSVTLVDGSTMTGALTHTNNGVVAQTTKGGSAADTLTANYQGDALYGNAGNDTLVANGESLVQLWGGAGNDTFNISTATINVNSYATINDLASGDLIKFTGAAANFQAAQIVLDPSTAVFQDYANAAIKGSAAGDVSWFQYNGNTYVVQNVSGLTSFVNGTDIIVKITGLVDLTTAVFSSTADTLKIV